MKAKVSAGLGLLVGALFVYAGVIKALDPAQFFADVQGYDLIPWRAATVALAFYLPWLEIIGGLAILVRPLHAAALLILSGLLLVFTVALALAWIRGLDISCGCFGGDPHHPRYFLWLARDIGLLAVTLTLLCSRDGPSQSSASLFLARLGKANAAAAKSPSANPKPRT